MSVASFKPSTSTVKAATARLVLFAGLLALSIGCSGSKSWDTTHPTTGTVEFKGKPAGNAELTFFPVDPNFPETVRPRAKTAADGTFTVSTYKEGDGAPAGKYKVTLVRNEVAVSRDTLVAKPNDLPTKVSRRDTTDIEVEIVAGTNSLPKIELK